MAVTTVEPGSTVVVVVVVDVVRRGRGEGKMSEGVETASGSGAGDPWGNTVWDVTAECVELAIALVVLFKVFLLPFLLRAVGVTITSCRREERRGGGGRLAYKYSHVADQLAPLADCFSISVDKMAKQKRSVASRCTSGNSNSSKRL